VELIGRVGIYRGELVKPNPTPLGGTYSPTVCGKGCFVSDAFRHVIPSAKGLAVRKPSPTISRRELALVLVVLRGLAGLADRNQASSVVVPEVGVDPVYHGLNRLPRISPRCSGRGLPE
jgi:hypothetical protein